MPTLSVDQLTTEALALPPEDRETLAQKLWDSVADRQEDWDPEFRRELQRRIEELDSGKVAELSHEEVMAAARRALECD